MANSLLEAIQSRMQERTQPQASDTLSQTKQISDVLGTKATGKAQPIEQGLPQGSNIAETSAKAQTMAESRQQSWAGAKAASQLGQAAEQQTKDIDFANRELGQQQLEASNNLLAQTSKVLDSYSNGLRELNFDKDKARMEQVGFGLRLSNEQYIDKLMREARKARLDDALSFREALQSSIFEDEEDLLNNDLEFRSLLKADERDFNRKLSEINIDLALSIARSQATQANAQAMYGGINSIVQGGVAAFQAYKPTSSNKGVEDLPEHFTTRPGTETLEGFNGA